MKFTLRDLFWLVLVLAIVLGWWIEFRRSQMRNRVLEANQAGLVKLIEQRNCGFTPIFSQTTGELVGTTEP